ncbi:hypothetical protein NI17_007665 [Thermobifida halotolerans]|uniref:Uncharacterized protein n=1 Tax=Thermobifida halotolerans TaxID=483545 RepID=A0AA97M5G7_9ACTN|nr:hypothetical protein [Thermobifida halotolerans]UOE21025.1 hypothetical protein NI17_007665 [Thermobifida halotolerans]
MDLIVAWNLLAAEARGVFRSAMDVDDATWALSTALIPLPYHRHTGSALAADARHVLAGGRTCV